MEKQIFLDRVRQTLAENGLDDKAIERQMTRLSRYIDEEGGENAESMLDEEDPVLLAEEICAILRRNAARRAAAEAIAAEEELPASKPQAETALEPAPVPVVEAVPAAAGMLPSEEAAARTREIDIVHPSQTFDIVDLSETAESEIPAADYTEMPTLNLDADMRTADFPTPDPPKKDRRDRRRKTLEVDQMESRAVAYAGEPGGPLFWGLFILSLPFAAAIGLAVLALFVVAFAALAALMVVCFAALIVTAAGGTAFTLVALIYGIVQALSTLPVGLYEIGIGITAGAIVLFSSILLYNFAVRLLPFAMKQLARFFGWTVRRLKMLFIYVKGACAKL